MSTMPERPKPRVKLVGIDGNAFVILGTVVRALKRAGYPAEEVKLFTAEATAGDYNHLLATCMEWCEVR